MICIAISTKDVNKCLELIKGEELAEIRLDLTGFNMEEIHLVFSQGIKLIATCRPDNLSYEVTEERLKQAISSGAKYVDIEYEAPVEYQKKIIQHARKHECQVIISYHNYDDTPGRDELENIVKNCYAMGADVAKLACMVTDMNDNANILSLYGKNRRLVALGMGELGIISRVMSLFLGAEFTFAAPDETVGTAPGQLKKSDLIRIVNTIKNV